MRSLKACELYLLLVWFPGQAFSEEANYRFVNASYGNSGYQQTLDRELVSRLFSKKVLLNFRKFEDFAHYYLEVVPKHGNDFLLKAASHSVFTIDIEPLVSHADPALYEAVNSPLNYFRYLSHLGATLRNLGLLNHFFDPGSVQLQDYGRAELTSLFDGEAFLPVQKSKFIPVAQGEMEKLFAESIWDLTLKHKGYDFPIVFSGFVDSDVAEALLQNTLFLDDTVFGLSWAHGKFSHLIQLGMLLDEGYLDRSRLTDIIIGHE